MFEPKPVAHHDLKVGMFTRALPGAAPGILWYVVRVVSADEEGRHRVVVWWSPDRPFTKWGMPSDCTLTTVESAPPVICGFNPSLPADLVMPGLDDFTQAAERMVARLAATRSPSWSSV